MKSSPALDAAAEVVHLGESQARHLRATFVHVDESLSRIEALCSGHFPPFSPELPDLDAHTSALVASLIGAVRRRMLEALERLGVERPLPTISARWSVETALHFAEIAFSDLDPGQMRGYGALSPATERELERVVRSFTALLERGSALLHQGHPAELARALAGIGGPEGKVLRGLARISRERGLFDLDPLIAAAADRTRSSTLDVGVFGRVSSGKSSLLNALVGALVLPVGAVPVSAVPVWIARGEPSVLAHRMIGQPEELAPDRVPLVATEAGNPENVLGLRRIEITIPGAPPGIRLLDTPGLGSLSTSKPALALDQLPRCDLGLVLVAAGAPLGSEELALLRGLAAAGIPSRVLLSKADLIPEPERAATLAYLRVECTRALGSSAAPGLTPVSVQDRGSIDELRGALVRAGASHEVDRSGTLRKRLLKLVSLASRGFGSTFTMEDDSERERLRESALAGARRHTEEVGSSAQQLMDAAASAALEAWRAGQDALAPVRDAIARTVAEGAFSVRRDVEGLEKALGGGEHRGRLAPLFDVAELGALDLRPPRAIPRRLLKPAAAHRLTTLEGPLQRALATYASRLIAWADAAIKEIGRDAAPPLGDHAALPPELIQLARLAESIGTAPSAEHSTGDAERRPGGGESQ